MEHQDGVRGRRPGLAGGEGASGLFLAEGKGKSKGRERVRVRVMERSEREHNPLCPLSFLSALLGLNDQRIDPFGTVGAS